MTPDTLTPETALNVNDIAFIKAAKAKIWRTVPSMVESQTQKALFEAGLRVPEFYGSPDHARFLGLMLQ